MKTSRATAERIRPILQAMERSIESARRRRLDVTGSRAGVRSVEAQDQAVCGEDLPRRKARPKRCAAPMQSYDTSEYRTDPA